MSQFSAAGVTSHGTPVRVLFGWDHFIGFWANVYDPSIDDEIPFVRFHSEIPDGLIAILTKYKINTRRQWFRA